MVFSTAFGPRTPRYRALALTSAEIDGERGGKPAVEGMERRMIRQALVRSGGVQTRAAELLGISERALRYKFNKYGLRGDKSSSS